MATSVGMLSVISAPLSRKELATPKYVTPLPRNVHMQVKCMSKCNDKDESFLSKLAPPSLKKEVENNDSPVSQLTSPPAKKISPKFIDVMGFAGPAPERINGRLAMVGFVTAMAVEISKGQDIFTQISNGGFQWFLWTSILLSIASLIPFLKGIGPGAAEDKAMTPDAELWNGRFAMLGLVALAITEYIKGGSLV